MVSKQEVLSVIEKDMFGVRDFRTRVTNFSAPYNITFVNGSGENKNLTMTDWAFDQLMLKLKMPPGYIKRCPYDSRVDIDLQGKNVNYWIKKFRDKIFLIRTKGQIVRAVLSNDDYTVINNIDLFEFLMKNLSDPKTKKEPVIKQYKLKPMQFHLELIIDLIIDEQKSAIGIMTINSEVGYHAVVLYPTIYCGDASFISDIRYYQKHAHVDSSSIFSGLAAKIAALLKKQPEIIQKFKASENVSVDIGEILEHLKLKYDIRKEEHNNIATAINDAHTLKDVVVGIGKASEMTSDLEREVELKIIGGKMLSRYTKEGVHRFVMVEEV